MTAAAPAPTDLKSALVELRASVAAQEAPKGVAGKLQTLILKFLETLLAMLADFRAGRFAAVVPEESAGKVLVDAGTGRGHHPLEGRRESRRAVVAGAEAVDVRIRNDAVGAEGAAAGDVSRHAESIRTERLPLSLPQGERKMDALGGCRWMAECARRSPRFAALLRSGGRRRNGVFSKNATMGDRIGAAISLRYKNESATT